MTCGDATRPRIRALTSLVVGLAVTNAVMLAPSAATAQAAGGRDTTTRTVRIQLRGKADGDTTFVRVVRASRDQLRQKLDSLQRQLQEMGAADPERAPIARQLRAVMMSLTELDHTSHLARASAEVGAQISAALARAAETSRFALRDYVDALPKGWIGIIVGAPHQFIVRNDSAYIRYFSYPEVVSVEPNSPAERAGITRGDHLVAYNGGNVRDREINLTSLLQPSRRITVTVKRDGEDRDYPVIVARAPRQYIERRELNAPDGPERDSAVRVFAVPRRASGQAPALVLFDKLDHASAPIAGATVEEIKNESLGRIFGVSSGILITDVLADPARASGLRGGDVIVRAAGREVTTIPQLRRLVESRSDERVIELEIVRERKPAVLTLRW